MAKPIPLPLGRANPHINQSRGAENYLMNFYVTNYSTSFVKPNTEIDKRRFHDIPAYSGGSVFKPRSAPAYKKSGFTSNERPQIYYRRTLDNLDNPEMGRILEENYNTITQLAFQPYDLNDGYEDLPVQVLGQKSAFTHTATHIPLDSKTKEIYIDTKTRAPFDVEPKHRARLGKINDHNPLSNENFGYGPNYMSTEYKTRFDKPKFPARLNTAIGPKEFSGFVANNEKDTLTGEPGERWLFRTRPIGVSDYKDRFLPFDYTRSETQLPNLTTAAQTRQSVYSKTFRPSDINPKGDLSNDTEYRDRFIGKQELDPTLAQQLGTAAVGPKELSGQTRCESGKVQQLDDPRRFITNYQMRHFDMNAKGKDREGFVVGGVQDQQPNGFTKSTVLHKTDGLNTFAEINGMDSYQSRSIRARDVYYDDHSHDNKLNAAVFN